MNPPSILDVKVLQIDQVHENQYNPNLMDDETMRLTRLSMAEEGFSDPIDVAPCKAKGHPKDCWVILDGEHRWKVAKEMGMTQIPVFVKERYGDDAVITTIRKDRTAGEPDLIKLAEVVGDLVDEFGPDEVQRRLGYDRSDQQAMIELTSWGWDAYGTSNQDQMDAARAAAEEITWSVTIEPEDRERIDALLPRFSDEATDGPLGDGDAGRFLAMLDLAVELSNDEREQSKPKKRRAKSG